MSNESFFGTGGGGPATVNTLSSEGGPDTPPNGNNFNFSGSVAGGSAVNGAIKFITPGGPGAATDGQMDAEVLVDGTTIHINASNQLSVINALPYTAVNHASSPYTVLSTDEYLGVTTTAGVVTILLPNTTNKGRVIVVKDTSGTSATNAITVTTVGGAVTIDGATTYTINTNFEAINLIFNGTSYEVF